MLSKRNQGAVTIVDISDLLTPGPVKAPPFFTPELTQLLDSNAKIVAFFSLHVILATAVVDPLIFYSFIQPANILHENFETREINMSSTQLALGSVNAIITAYVDTFMLLEYQSAVLPSLIKTIRELSLKSRPSIRGVVHTYFDACFAFSLADITYQSFQLMTENPLLLSLVSSMAFATYFTGAYIATQNIHTQTIDRFSNDSHIRKDYALTMRAINPKYLPEVDRMLTLVKKRVLGDEQHANKSLTQGQLNMLIEQFATELFPIAVKHPDFILGNPKTPLRTFLLENAFDFSTFLLFSIPAAFIISQKSYDSLHNLTNNPNFLEIPIGLSAGTAASVILGMKGLELRQTLSEMLPPSKNPKRFIAYLSLLTLFSLCLGSAFDSLGQSAFNNPNNTFDIKTSNPNTSSAANLLTMLFFISGICFFMNAQLKRKSMIGNFFNKLTPPASTLTKNQLARKIEHHPLSERTMQALKKYSLLSSTLEQNSTTDDNDLDLRSVLK